MSAELIQNLPQIILALATLITAVAKIVKEIKKNKFSPFRGVFLCILVCITAARREEIDEPSSMRSTCTS